MNRNLKFALKVVATVIVIGLFSWGLYSLSSWGEQNKANHLREQVQAGYTEGYCAALGGTVLNADTCNVEGKVVKVVRP